MHLALPPPIFSITSRGNTINNPCLLNVFNWSLVKPLWAVFDITMNRCPFLFFIWKIFPQRYFSVCSIEIVMISLLVFFRLDITFSWSSFTIPSSHIAANFSPTARSPYAENAIKTNCFLMIFKRPMSKNELLGHQNSHQI